MPHTKPIFEIMRRKVKRDFERFMSQLIRAIDNNCKIDDDGDFVILVGDEDYNHERLYMNPELFKEMWHDFA